MATNLHKKYTESKTREIPVPEGTQSGTLVVTAGGEVAVTLTARGDSTRAAITLPDGSTLTGVANGGAGNAPTRTTAAFDGSWRFPVEGVTNGDISDEDLNTPVFQAANGDLTLTEGGTFVGVLDDGRVVGGIAPVKIGVIR